MRNHAPGSDEAGLAPVSFLSDARPASSGSDPVSSSESTSREESDAPRGAGGEAVVTSISGVGLESRPRVGPAGAASLADELPDNEPEVVDRAVVEQRVRRALSRKALSEKEVRALIADNGLEGPEAEEIVERLVELRYVDDALLAEELTRRLSERKGQSKSAVARSLSQRGLASDVVSEALSEIDDGEERRVAFEIAEKRARQMGSLDAQTLERRLSGFLARRGYPGGLVRDIVSEIARRRPSASSGPRFR